VTAWLRRLFCGHNSRETITTPETGPGWVGHRSECHCLDCGKSLPVEVGPSRRIVVRRSHVYAARARVDLDRQSGRETEAWIKSLAETDPL